ncbi:HAD family hydrolase, partial [Acinetobacter baumannii]
NSNFLKSAGIKTQLLETQAEKLRGDGATVINVAVDGRLAGILAIADPVKASTPDALKLLAAEGIKVIMLTGDNRTTASAIARRLGIPDV